MAKSRKPSGLGIEKIVFLAMLAFSPASVLGHLLHWPGTLVFVFSCLAVLPLARFMGEATEGLAHRLGSGVGALLNATFGNAAEMILAFAALRAGEIAIVKASLTGSIIANLLLILGVAMVAGGARRRSQKFNATAAMAGSGLMVLALAAFVVPDVFHLSHPAAPRGLLLKLSVGLSVVLLVLYALSLVFALRTHAHLYTDEDDVVAAHPTWSVRRSLAVLVAATVGVAIVSEVLVHALSAAVASIGFTRTFVGVIVVAVIGNAAEHSTAVIVALRDKMNLAFTIAFESSKQVALFVAPVLVIVGGFIGRPMDLEFSHLEVVGIGLGVAASTLIAIDGESNWLEGAMLLGVYAVLGVAFYFTP